MNKDDIRDRALDFVRKHDMLKQRERVVAGISGGADSMCLLGLLLEWRDLLDLEIHVVHVNHGIRGKAADTDEEFVTDFCRSHKVDFRAVHADIPALARKCGQSEEEAGRNLRYEAFRETAQELGCSRIAVAHNRSDNAETVIFNMLRGSGPAGLKGILPVRKLKDSGIDIIRPLLNTSREEIEFWLSENGIGFRTDETNLEEQYSRNIIRNIVMPLFKERINSASEEHIVQLAYRTAQVEEFARKAADEAMAEMEADGRISVTGKNKSGGGSFGYRINAAALREKGGLLTNMIIRNLMGRLAGGLKDIGSVHIEDAAALLDKQTGRKIDLPYGIEARREYDDLVLEKDAGTVKGGFSFRIGKDELEELSETSPMIVELPADNASGFVKLKLYLTEPPTDRDFSKNLYTEYFDCDKIKNGVEIRTRREGDRLLIKRGGGSAGLAGKSLKSWMIDNKIPLRERDSILLAADSEHILWIMGRRRDDSCFIDGNTTKVLVMILE